jgi:hypothetical protein
LVATSMAIGEEDDGDGDGPVLTTEAIGEEDDGDGDGPVLTTELIGEEDDGDGDGPGISTRAGGEEDDEDTLAYLIFHGPALTTEAIGEEDTPETDQERSLDTVTEDEPGVVVCSFWIGEEDEDFEAKPQIIAEWDGLS